MRIVLDASAAYEFLDSSSYDAVFIGVSDILAPDLLAPELFNARWKTARSGVNAPTIDDILSLLARIRLLPTLTYCSEAATIAELLDHPVYGAFYVAIAQRERGRLLTADVRLQRKLRSHDLGHLLA